MTDIQIRYWSHQENVRHNLAYEAETYRANIARESQLARELVETHRANVARESENFRSNTAREFETWRSNVARESETYRSNVARETETHRSNIAQESIGRSMASASMMQAKAATSQAATAKARQTTYEEISKAQAGKLGAETTALDMSNAVRAFNLDKEKVTSAIVSNLQPIEKIVDILNPLSKMFGGKK